MKKFFILITCFISFTFFSQNKSALHAAFLKQYPFEYRLRIPDFPSYCYYLSDTPVKPVSDSNVHEITIKVVENNGSPIPFACTELTSSKGETLKFFADENGLVKEKIPVDDYRLTIRTGNFTPLDEIVRFNFSRRETTVTAVLGKSFTLVIPVLRSKRKLTEKEIIEITTDLSNDNRNSKLIVNKTCSLVFEI